MNMSSDLAQRIFFTLIILVVCRFGSFIPVAGLDSSALESITNINNTGILGMFNMLSGGSLGRMSIFALAIMPYITASIITQLLSIAYKPLENLKKEGELGRRKISQLSRYLTVILAAVQAYGLSVGLEAMTTVKGPIVIIPGLYFRLITVITLVVGTIFLMWLGEQITTKGIGNGSSLIIFVGIISSVPSAIINMFELARKGVLSPITIILVLTGIIILTLIIIFFEKAHRKVLVQYPKRQVGNKMYGGDSTHLPLKLNTAGVIPPIFAGSILSFPITISSFSQNRSPLLDWITFHFSHGKLLYVLTYLLLIIIFSFIYTAIVFNSEETSENLKKHGAYIPGRRPGTNTAEYLDFILMRLTVIGSIYLCIICIVPEVIINKYAVAFSLGGTSFLIVINVILDTFGQIQTYMFNNRYESLVKKMKIKTR